jgi:glycosyltransferase involved in cell wall biosynthesis
VVTKTLGPESTPRPCKRIVILTGGHLCHNPRAIKEACALAQAGYQVEIWGAWFDPDLKRRDQALLNPVPFTFKPVVDFTKNRVARLIGRVRSKVGRLAHQSLRFESDWQLNPSVPALKKAANKSDADLFIAHSEPGMVVAADLLTKDKKVGLDMEDWFSEDLLPEARRRRPLKKLRRLEKLLLTHGSYNSCPSLAMGRGLVGEYRCKAPAVIYNAFPWSDRKDIDGLIKDRRNPQLPSIHWYSQTLGFGRGLEDLIAALPLLQQEAEIHLRGRPIKGFKEWLASRLNEEWRARVFLHHLVPNDELLSRIAEHDIGFAGEQKYCKSRDLTITNKILHYLLGGLAVVASDTAGQREVAEQTREAVHIYRVGDPHDLAARLNFLLSSDAELAKTKEASLAAAKETFCWEMQAPKLVRAVEAALSGERR